MSYTTVKSNTEASQILKHGNILKKDGVGGYSVEYNGKTYYIPKYQALLTFNETYWPKHFTDYYKKMYDESENKRKELKAEENELKNLRRKFEKMYTSALDGAKSIKEITDQSRKQLAIKCKNKLNGIASSLRLNSAQFFSECHRGLDAALKGGEWNTILAGTEQIAQNLT